MGRQIRRTGFANCCRARSRLATLVRTRHTALAHRTHPKRACQGIRRKNGGEGNDQQRSKSQLHPLSWTPRERFGRNILSHDLQTQCLSGAENVPAAMPDFERILAFEILTCVSSSSESDAVCLGAYKDLGGAKRCGVANPKLIGRNGSILLSIFGASTDQECV